jgi:2-C-methyl-D-erythritol 4-phosphate cytidylyltransferase
MKKYAIIVGAGSGSRMGTNVPKQFLLLGDYPIFMHTIKKYHHAIPSIKIIVVLPEAYINYWNDLIDRYKFNIAHLQVAGDEQRFLSVKNALNSIPPVAEDALVAIHDAVRPLTSEKLIQQSFAKAGQKGTAIAAVSLKDSIRRIEGKISYAENRNAFKIIQTPQTFLLSILRKSYSVPWSDRFTDDASVVEHSGYPIHLIEGEYTNIKITTPEDLTICEALLQKNIG